MVSPVAAVPGGGLVHDDFGPSAEGELLHCWICCFAFANPSIMAALTAGSWEAASAAALAAASAARKDPPEADGCAARRRAVQASTRRWTSSSLSSPWR